MNLPSSTLAIDPGAGGGIAWTTAAGVAHAVAMPNTEADIIQFLERFRGFTMAVIEDVGSGIMPGRAVAMIKLNVNAAVIRTALYLYGVPTVKVRPQEWTKNLGLGTSKTCASATIWKNKLKAEAQRRFPSVPKITLATCDALLLLDYALKRYPFAPAALDNPHSA